MTSTISSQVNEEGIIAEGIPEEEGKFCADCKHLLGVRYKTETAENWRCVHPNNMIEMKEHLDLVTGIKKYIRVYKVEDIHILRDKNVPSTWLTNKNLIDVCGPEGKWYEKYEAPVHQAQPTIGGKEATEFLANPISPETLAANRTAAQDRIAAIKAKKLKPNDLDNL